MYGAYRVSPLGCAFYTLVGLTILMLWITSMIFHDWRVETAGVWTTGQITHISHCHNSHDQVLSTVQFTVVYTDTRGVHHTSQTNCEYDTYRTGQSIALRYLPGDPNYVLTRADIGGGQGFPLLMVSILDVVFSTLVAVGAFLWIRAARRKRAVQSQMASMAAITPDLHADHQPRHGRLPRRLRHQH